MTEILKGAAFEGHRAARQPSDALYIPRYQRGPSMFPPPPKTDLAVYYVIAADYNAALHLVDLIKSKQIPDLYHSKGAALDAQSRYPLGGDRTFSVYAVREKPQMAPTQERTLPPLKPIDTRDEWERVKESIAAERAAWSTTWARLVGLFARGLR